ncbi:MAG: hypothetical protein F6K28_60965 [Microcoleus sp. SIO2G3]|nr:hypothetical protein [Microcoleus sp. SIO2G3]
MGFSTTVFGYVKIAGDLDRAISEIAKLASIDTPEWPPLPREMFSVAQHPQSLISYKNEHLVHFGMCVKEINWEWAAWLDRFEDLFKRMQAIEAFVVLEIPNWCSDEFDGRFYYKWQLDSTGEWQFTGSPRQF